MGMGLLDYLRSKRDEYQQEQQDEKYREYLESRNQYTPDLVTRVMKDNPQSIMDYAMKGPPNRRPMSPYADEEQRRKSISDGVFNQYMGLPTHQLSWDDQAMFDQDMANMMSKKRHEYEAANMNQISDHGFANSYDILNDPNNEIDRLKYMGQIFEESSDDAAREALRELQTDELLRRLNPKKEEPLNMKGLMGV